MITGSVLLCLMHCTLDHLYGLRIKDFEAYTIIYAIIVCYYPSTASVNYSMLRVYGLRLDKWTDSTPLTSEETACSRVPGGICYQRASRSGLCFVIAFGKL